VFAVPVGPVEVTTRSTGARTACTHRRTCLRPRNGRVSDTVAKKRFAAKPGCAQGWERPGANDGKIASQP